MQETNISLLERLIAAIDGILDDKNTIITCERDGLEQIGFNSKGLPKRELFKLFRELYSKSETRWKVFPEMFTLEVSEVALKKHIVFFNELFADYVDLNTGLMHVSSIIQGEQGFFEISSIDFIKSYFAHAAVLLGSLEASKLLIEWTSRNEIEYTEKFHLHGIEVESPLTLDYESFRGIVVNPPDRECFDIMLNDWTESGLEAGVGAIVTIRKTVPLFSKPQKSGNIDCADGMERDSEFIDLVCKCLSLVLNTFVSLNCSWVHSWNILPFHMDAKFEQDSAKPSEHAPSILNQEKLNWALKILTNFRKLRTNKRFRISMDRWLKSIHSLTEYGDKIINMRIAMEALLLKGNESGIREKLAIISAKFLAADMPGKKKIRDLVENFYKDSSSVIHGSKDAEDIDIEINAIQNLWNRLMLKILEEGKIPNWNDIVLE